MNSVSCLTVHKSTGQKVVQTALNAQTVKKIPISFGSIHSIRISLYLTKSQNTYLKRTNQDFSIQQNKFLAVHCITANRFDLVS